MRERWMLLVGVMLLVGGLGAGGHSASPAAASPPSAPHWAPAPPLQATVGGTDQPDLQPHHQAPPVELPANPAGSVEAVGGSISAHEHGVVYSRALGTRSAERSEPAGSVTAAQLVTPAGGIPVRLTAALSGTAEVPGPGDPDATGSAIVTLNSALRLVCADLMVANSAAPTAAHIHIGAAGVAGPVFIPLPTPPIGSSSACVADVDAALIEAVVQDPAGYYVNVHTADYPAGALRGQLAAGSLAIASLTGAAEAPGPGDPDGTGLAVITLNQGQQMVCYDLDVANLATPTAAHIHFGAVGVAGPISVTLGTPTTGTASGCVTGVDPAVVGAIGSNPAGYYVNVHTGDFPAGAVRGQLGSALRLATVLTGTQEVPGPGDPDGTGAAVILLSQGQGTVCYSLSVANLSTPVAAHIHNGPAGVAGPISVTLGTPVGGIANGCTAADSAIIGAISQSPLGYYVNVHTSDYPAGAVRGQLDDEGAAVRLSTAMSGSEETSPADPDGTGTARLTLNQSRGTVCYDLTVANIATPVAAHIHAGAAGVAGPIVVTLGTPAAGSAIGCVPGVDPGLIATILQAPANYYVNIHTSDFPAGAVRGQLAADRLISLPVILGTWTAGW